MFTEPFFAEDATADGYAYQTIVTPDPYDGTPVCSLLLLSLADHVAVRSTLLYDVSRDKAQADYYRSKLVRGKVPPAKACDLISEWICDPTFI